MQVDAFSLNAQREKIKKYAEYQNMDIVEEFSDEGKSGKNIKGRTAFQEMLSKIESGVDNVSYVLVFKLSRFGRNASDVLSSLQLMQDYNVNLICIEDGIDSSKDSGKLMISVLSAVAEIERENILVQTMEGRKQKAREGKWNGGFAPYGYRLVNGELILHEEEAKVVKLIYNKFATTSMGINAIAKYLNELGYKKEIRSNNKYDGFSTYFIKGVLDNPIYNGKIAYGRRKNEKIPGTRNEYHMVKQKEFMIYDGIHEKIIDDGLWQAVQKKRKETSIPYVKKHSLDHEHLLSGILKCPSCGAPMYGNVSRRKNKDGEFYKEHFYYACKHRLAVDGRFCSYKKQWREELVDEAVKHFICQLVNNPKFKKALDKKVNSETDVSEIELKIKTLESTHSKLEKLKERLGNQMDSLDINDKFYEQKYQNLEQRWQHSFEEIEETDNQLATLSKRLESAQNDKLTTDIIYKILENFNLVYDVLNDKEKKKMLCSIIEKVEIHKERKENGAILKSIRLKFPVYYGNNMCQDFYWDNQNHVECVVLMSRVNPKK